MSALEVTADLEWSKYLRSISQLRQPRR